MDIQAIWNWIVAFADSNFFVALVTFLVGLLAFRVYARQKADNKKDAASIILQEMKNAEAQLLQAKEIVARDNVFPVSVETMNKRSWDIYGYLFIRDFTSDEWQYVDNFYKKCKEFDEAIQYNKTFFEKNEEQIRVNLHEALSDYTKTLLKNVREGFAIEDEQDRAEHFQTIHQDYKGEIDVFYETFLENMTSRDSKFFYQPKKPFEDVQVILNTVRTDLTTSTVGIKLTALVEKKNQIIPSPFRG